MEEHVFDQLPAYALDCLDKEEAELVRRHLVGCETCRMELLSYQRISDRLGLAAPMADPPAGLKDRVMAGAVAKGRTGPVPQRENTFGRIFRPLPFVWRLVGLVGLSVVVVLVISNVLLWRRVIQSPGQPSGFQVVALTGTDGTPDASGMIVMSGDGKSGTLIVDGLPDLDRDQQYQLWLIKDGHRTNGGVFSVSYDGYGSMWVSSPEPLVDYSAFGITIEPRGGSPGPTGAKVLGGEL